MANSIKEGYIDEECPDCGEEIPEDVVSGQACKNCEHIFTDLVNDED